MELFVEAASTPNAARVATKLAMFEELAGKTAEARLHYAQAVDWYRASGDRAHIPMCLNNLGMLHKSAGHLEEARALFHEGLDEAIALHGPNHPEVALLASNLGVALTELGDLGGAEQRHMQALGIREALYGANHPDVALSMGNLAVVYHMRGDLRKAAAFYEGAIEILEKFPGINPAEKAILKQNRASLDA